MKVEQNSVYVSSQMMYSSQVKKQEQVQPGTFASQIKSKDMPYLFVKSSVALNLS